jgi:uroporphyrinogen-III synthase
LFAVSAVAWDAPDPRAFDFLLLTSANAVRHGGPGLARLRGLAVLAVGLATAAAARAAGFSIAQIGEGGVAALLAGVTAGQRLLHLTGVDHQAAGTRHHIHTIAVYRAAPLECVLPAGECVALVHSARAGARLAELAHERGAITIVALSAGAAAACGTGWAGVATPERPDEAALLALAARLCQE